MKGVKSEKRAILAEGELKNIKPRMNAKNWDPQITQIAQILFLVVHHKAAKKHEEILPLILR